MFQGTKPDFHNAMPANMSKQLYEQFLHRLGNEYKPEKIKGKFYFIK